MERAAVKFPRGESEFFSEVRNRVNAYFRDNNISRYGDYRMVIKTVVLISSYFLIYSLIISRVSEDAVLNAILWILLGLSLAGIGLSVMHDASHGAYSKNKKVNRLLSNTMALIGGSVFTWNIQHNQLHHSFTNVDGLDEDIDPSFVMRFSPHKKRYWMHRFQHLYAWFFYGIMTLTWSTDKDFVQLYRYRNNPDFTLGKIRFSWLLTRLIMAKIFFHTFTLILPLILLPDPWYVTLMNTFTMHFVAGFTLACVFQPAHVVPTSDYPLPDDKGSMENAWAIHQMHTTANFAPGSRIFSWYVGGLNYQIEHHLFPNVCHVHHREISKIVKKTAEEYGLPYNVQPTFLKALYEHARMLKMLGRQDYLQVRPG